jgi:hypothetical protein
MRSRAAAGDGVAIRKKLPLSLRDFELLILAETSSHGSFLVAMVFLLEVAHSCNRFVQLAIKPVQVPIRPGLFSWPVAACIRHPMKEIQAAAAVVGCSQVKKVGRSTICRNPNT